MFALLYKNRTIAVVSLVMLFAFCLHISWATLVSATEIPGLIKCVVIDAGHGGFDGGAVAKDGTLEKNLNLAVAKELEIALLRVGIDVILTRSDDAALGTTGGGSSKNADMRERVRILREADNAVFISIHMNQFSLAQYRGTQVFYAADAQGSKELADSLQGAVTSLVQPENRRVSQKASDSLYILKRADCPAVIVECGFLSNEEELCLLKDPAYQARLAEALCSGIQRYVEEYNTAFLTGAAL